MPDFGAREFHRIEIAASPERTFGALFDADLAGSGVVRGLLALRAVPSMLQADTSFAEVKRRATASVTLRSFEKSGFRIVEQDSPREVVIGLEGRFWTPSGGICRQDPDMYLQPIPAGAVRAMWNFAIAPLAAGRSALSTETRIAWSDPEAGRSFMRYWRFVQPFSGLIRTFMLRSIAAEATKT